MPDPATATDAAVAVARAHGVRCEEAVRLPGASNVLVHLRPAPVVARVMTATALLHDDVATWLRRELAVGAFLGTRDLAIPPSSLLPPGPHRHAGLWMTFWTFAEHEPATAPPPPRELGAALRALHATLAEFPGALGPLDDVRAWLDRLLAGLRPTAELPAAERDRLRARLHALAPTAFAGADAQPIHGDASVSNLLRTPAGLRWNDLEDACVGPPAWDVAGLVLDLRSRGADEADVDAFLRAYGGPALGELADALEAHAVYATTWRAFTAQRP